MVSLMVMDDLLYEYTAVDGWMDGGRSGPAGRLGQVQAGVDICGEGCLVGSASCMGCMPGWSLFDSLFYTLFVKLIWSWRIYKCMSTIPSMQHNIMPLGLAVG